MLVLLLELWGVVRGTRRGSGPSPPPSRHRWIWETQLLFGLAAAPAVWTSVTINQDQPPERTSISLGPNGKLK